jgi:hypothetical protein
MISNADATVLFPLLFGAMALFLLGIGLRGMISGKPLVMSSLWFFIAYVLSMVSSSLPFIPLWERGREFTGVLRDIIRGMDGYYQSRGVSKTNVTCSIFFVVIGAAELLFVFRAVF